MNKDQLFPLIFGLVLGVLLMFFWNLGSSLNNQSMRISQLEQAANSNSQNIAEVINFLEQPAPEGDMTEGGSPMITE